jgi:hypothetical protein
MVVAKFWQGLAKFCKQYLAKQERRIAEKSDVYLSGLGMAKRDGA